MRNSKSTSFLLKSILISVLIMLALSAFSNPVESADSVLINKDGSITIKRELWEKHARALLRQDELLSDVANENRALRNKIDELLSFKCVRSK